MPNKIITELARHAREAFEKLLNAVEQHEAVQRDLPATNQVERPAADAKPAEATNKAVKPAAETKPDQK